VSLPLSLDRAHAGFADRARSVTRRRGGIDSHVGRGRPSGVVGRSESDCDDDGFDDGGNRGENSTEIYPGLGLRRGESSGDARGQMRVRTQRTAVGRGVACETPEAKSNESRPAVGATEAEFEAAERNVWQRRRV
jgi:hypothetical protein